MIWFRFSFQRHGRGPDTPFQCQIDISSNAASGQLSVGRNAACGVRDSKRSPSRVVLSPKVRLSLQVCRRELSAAFHGRPNEQVLLVPSRPVLIPFLRTVYSVVQFGNPGTNTGDTASSM